MEDVLTETPPPSRFFDDDLDNFAAPSPPLCPPFLVLSSPNPNPNLLLIAISAPSVALLHRIPNKTLIGTLILPETPLSGNSLYASPRDRSIDIYAAGDAVLVSVQCAVAAERAKVVARAVVGALAASARVVVLDSIKRGSFRGRLTGDEAVAYKVETAEQRVAGDGPAVEWMPAGSVVDGLGAAVMGECQMRRIKATMCATWPDQGRPSPVPLVATVMKGLGLELGGAEGEAFGEVCSGFESDLYT